MRNLIRDFVVVVAESASQLEQNWRWRKPNWAWKASKLISTRTRWGFIWNNLWQWPPEPGYSSETRPHAAMLTLKQTDSDHLVQVTSVAGAGPFLIFRLRLQANFKTGSGSGSWLQLLKKYDNIQKVTVTFLNIKLKNITEYRYLKLSLFHQLCKIFSFFLNFPHAVDIFFCKYIV